MGRVAQNDLQGIDFMRDKVEIHIDCDDNTVTVNRTVPVVDELRFQIPTAKAMLIAQLLAPDIKRMMKMSTTELQAEYTESM